VSTAILLFTKTNSGGTDHVWFYDMRGRRLEPGRQAQPLLPEDKLGVCRAARSERGGARQEQPARCAGALAAARRRRTRERPRTDQSFCVPKADIAAKGYDLSHQPLQGSGA
jgi:type I restriction enzyme M protein